MHHYKFMPHQNLKPKPKPAINIQHYISLGHAEELPIVAHVFCLVQKKTYRPKLHAVDGCVQIHSISSKKHNKMFQTNNPFLKFHGKLLQEASMHLLHALSKK